MDIGYSLITLYTLLHSSILMGYVRTTLCSGSLTSAPLLTI